MPIAYIPWPIAIAKIAKQVAEGAESQLQLLDRASLANQADE
ncbi:hypothetical protein [Arthrospira platensis]